MAPNLSGVSGFLEFFIAFSGKFPVFMKSLLRTLQLFYFTQILHVNTDIFLKGTSK